MLTDGVRSGLITWNQAGSQTSTTGGMRRSSTASTALRVLVRP